MIVQYDVGGGPAGTVPWSPVCGGQEGGAQQGGEPAAPPALRAICCAGAWAAGTGVAGEILLGRLNRHHVRGCGWGYRRVRL
jgi:hypothetical protein